MSEGSYFYFYCFINNKTSYILERWDTNRITYRIISRRLETSSEQDKMIVKLNYY